MPQPPRVALAVVTRAHPGGLKVFGLTGGIGSGSRPWPGCSPRAASRSSTPTRWRARWWPPGGPAHADVAAAWPEAIAADGALDRKRLGDDRLRRSGGAGAAGGDHPPADRRGRRRAAGGAGRRGAPAGALRGDAAGRERPLARLRRPHRGDRLEETQIARAMARDGLSRAQAEARIARAAADRGEGPRRHPRHRQRRRLRRHRSAGGRAAGQAREEATTGRGSG